MKTFSFIFLSLFACEIIRAESNSQKNVVIIIADDLGFNDLSYRGSNEFPTYNIDALAYNGIILDRFYAAPLCTPSRASLLTGKYAHHVGMQNFVIASDDPFGLGVDEKIMPQYFKDAGYSTHLIGKWHQGFFQEQYWPSNRGFDTFFGYLGPYIDYFDYTLQMFNRNYSRGYDMRRDLNVDVSHDHVYATDMFTKEAIDIIDNKQKEKPLFLIISHLAPHAGNDDIPLQAKPEDYEKFPYIENEERRKLAGMVQSLDDSVGEIVEALVRTGLMNDTILVFFSDNGGPSAFLHATQASNYPLRGQKESPWEGGIRTDALIYAPFLPSGVIRKDFFHISDLLPTLATLANAGFIIYQNIDGIDLSKMITSGSVSLRNEVITIDDVFGYSSFIFNGIKYVNGSSSNGQADTWLGSNNNSDINASGYVDEVFNSKAAKALRNFHETLTSASIKELRSNLKVECAGIKHECNLLEAPCLFDIQNDPCEENNLAAANPVMMEEMTKTFNERLKTLVPARRKTRDPNCDPAKFNFTWSAWESNRAGKLSKISKRILFGVSALIGAYTLFTKYL